MSLVFLLTSERTSPLRKAMVATALSFVIFFRLFIAIVLSEDRASTLSASVTPGSQTPSEFILIRNSLKEVMAVDRLEVSIVVDIVVEVIGNNVQRVTS